MYMLRQNKAIDTFSYRGLKEARILRISKDDLRLFEYQVVWDKELENEVVEYWDILNRAWEFYQNADRLPACTCAKYEVNSKTGKGFMADKRFNPYFYDGEPCSSAWFELNKKERIAS